MKIAIIGAGIAGLSAALLLDSDHEVVIFERNDYLGGHARTVQLEKDGKHAYANPAFTYITPTMYPRFVRLLDVLGVERVPSPVSLTVYSKSLAQSVYLTPTLSPLRLSPILNPIRLYQLIRVQWLMRVAKIFDERDDWQTTLEEFVESQSLSPFIKNSIVYPWIAALSGVSIAEAKNFSARAALKYPVHVQSEGVIRSFSLQEIKDGVHAYIQPLVSRLRTTQIYKSVNLRPIEKADGKFILTESTGIQHIFDHVVMASPAYETVKLLSSLPGADRLRAILSRFPYFQARIVLHSDDKFMPKRRSDWSGYNAIHDGPNCEATMWCRNNGEFDYFKSWMTYVADPPTNNYGEFQFHHPLMTPDYYSAQAELTAWQGQENLWFAGSYIQDVDSHESGINSAIQIARRLNPKSANLASLLDGHSTK